MLFYRRRQCRCGTVCQFDSVRYVQTRGLAHILDKAQCVVGQPFGNQFSVDFGIQYNHGCVVRQCRACDTITHRQTIFKFIWVQGVFRHNQFVTHKFIFALLYRWNNFAQCATQTCANLWRNQVNKTVGNITDIWREIDVFHIQFIGNNVCICMQVTARNRDFGQRQTIAQFVLFAQLFPNRYNRLHVTHIRYDFFVCIRRHRERFQMYGFCPSQVFIDIFTDKWCEWCKALAQRHQHVMQRVKRIGIFVPETCT